jgi:hypothetical protein
VAGHLDVSGQRGQGDRGIGGVNDEARSPLENRVILILPVTRGAISSAILETRNATPKIPAARSLTEIAPESAHVPQGRRADCLTGLRERHETLAHFGVSGNIVNTCRGRNPESPIGKSRDCFTTQDRAKVDQRRRSFESLLDADKQVRTSPERLRIRKGEELGRLSE